MEKISLPVRIFAILIVLAGLAGMLAMRTMGPSADALAPIPQPVKKAAAGGARKGSNAAGQGRRERPHARRPRSQHRRSRSPS